MMRRPPRLIRTYTLMPYTMLFLSGRRADVRRSLGGAVSHLSQAPQACDPAPVLVHEPGRQRDDAELLVFSHKQDAVGVVQNLFPAFTAAYSLYLDIRH